jgi:hypothetical protein
MLALCNAALTNGPGIITIATGPTVLPVPVVCGAPAGFVPRTA